MGWTKSPSRTGGAQHYQTLVTVDKATLEASLEVRRLLPSEAPTVAPRTPREVLKCNTCERPQLSGQGRRMFLEEDPLGGWRCRSRKACRENMPSLH